MVEYTEKALERKILSIEKQLCEVMKERLLQVGLDDDYSEGYMDGIEDAVVEMQEAFMLYFPEIAAKRLQQ